MKQCYYISPYDVMVYGEEMNTLVQGLFFEFTSIQGDLSSHQFFFIETVLLTSQRIAAGLTPVKVPHGGSGQFRFDVLPERGVESDPLYRRPIGHPRNEDTIRMTSNGKDSLNLALAHGSYYVTLAAPALIIACSVDTTYIFVVTTSNEQLAPLSSCIRHLN